MVESLHSFLEKTYALVAEGRQRHALREMGNFILDTLANEEFDTIDSLLEQADAQRAGALVCLGMMGYTRYCKDKLPHRAILSKQAIELNLHEDNEMTLGMLR